MKLKATFLCLAALLGAALQARAHAIWATIENGQVHFSLKEGSGGKPEARFAPYVATLKARCGSGVLSLGNAREGVRTARMTYGFAVAYGENQKGVEKGEEHFLARFHAKAAASLKDAASGSGASFDLTAQLHDETLIVRVWEKRKPLAESDIELQWPGATEKLIQKSDANGYVHFAWQGDKYSGYVGIRASKTIEKRVSFEKKAYPKTRQQVTLTFPVVGSGLAGNNFKN
jgi:hypothetical protein